VSTAVSSAVSFVAPRAPALAVAVALLIAEGACTSLASPRLGFSTDYAPPASADAGVVDAGTSAPDADGAATDAASGAAPALRSVRGTGSGVGWAVGEAGTALILSGGRWVPAPSGTTATLGGLGALDVGHAFAVELGGPRVLAWTGRAWSPLGADRADRAAAATLAASVNDVWVVGDGIEHWDGRAWTQQVPGGAGAASTFTAISASFRTDVWAVGPAGAWHYDGTAWAAVSLPAGAPTLADVWTFSLADTWIAGAQGAVLVWDGSSLTQVSTGTTEDLTAITGSGPDDVWVGGKTGTLVHWNGTTWLATTTPSGRPINDLWEDAPGDLYFVDDTGSIGRYSY